MHIASKWSVSAFAFVSEAKYESKKWCACCFWHKIWEKVGENLVNDCLLATFSRLVYSLAQTHCMHTTCTVTSQSYFVYVEHLFSVFIFSSNTIVLFWMMGFVSHDYSSGIVWGAMLTCHITGATQCSRTTVLKIIWLWPLLLWTTWIPFHIGHV